MNFLETALRHIESCRVCLSRMQEGVELLKSNEKVNRAFQIDESEQCCFSNFITELKHGTGLLKKETLWV